MAETLAGAGVAAGAVAAGVEVVVIGLEPTIMPEQHCCW